MGFGFIAQALYYLYIDINNNCYCIYTIKYGILKVRSSRKGELKMDITRKNMYQLRQFDPYNSYFYTVQILYPLFPIGESKVKAPEVKMSDFYGWAGSFVGVQDDNSPYFLLAQKLLEIGKEMVDVRLVGGLMYERLVCYYAGHYLERHLQILKQERNEHSLDPSINPKSDKVYEIEYDYPDGSRQDFRTTTLGQLFYGIYGKISKFAGSQEDGDNVWGGIF